MVYGCSVKWTFTTQQAQNEWELSFQDAWHYARWERNMVSTLSVRGSLSPQMMTEQSPSLVLNMGWPGQNLFQKEHFGCRVKVYN